MNTTIMEPNLSSSPSRLAQYSSYLWAHQYGEPKISSNFWQPHQMQPSSNIWGPQLRMSENEHLQNQIQNQNLPPLQTFTTGNVQYFASKGNNGSMGSMGVGNVGTLSPENLSPVSSSTVLSKAHLNATSPRMAYGYEDRRMVSPPPSPPLYNDQQPSHAAQFSQTPESTIISPTCGPLYLVKFKGNRVNVFTATGTAVYKTGDFVMVDADRGKDLGTVICANISRSEAASLKHKHYMDRHQALHSNTPLSTSPSSQISGPNVYSPKQILSLATESEIADMLSKTNDEANAVQLCNRKSVEHNLTMSIVDAEYQWDRRKLTFFYVANSRVDFRDLVRELFRIYKTRIWMCAADARS